MLVAEIKRCEEECEEAIAAFDEFAPSPDSWPHIQRIVDSWTTLVTLVIKPHVARLIEKDEGGRNDLYKDRGRWNFYAAEALVNAGVVMMNRVPKAVLTVEEFARLVVISHINACCESEQEMQFVLEYVRTHWKAANGEATQTPEAAPAA